MINVYWKQGQLSVGYCWSRDDGVPVVDEFAIGETIDKVAMKVVEQLRHYDDPEGYAGGFGKTGIVTGRQRSVSSALSNLLNTST